MISSSPTALITMHNVKRFLEEATYVIFIVDHRQRLKFVKTIRFEPSQDTRTRATAEGNMRPEDLIPIYRKRTTIDTSGRETVTQAKYFIVDSVEALSKFNADA
jgi:parafibromin